MMLMEQSVKRVLYPNMTEPEFRSVCACSLGFFEHYSAGSKRHAWGDVVDVLSFNLSGRAFQAVVGMDVLGKGVLTIENGVAVSFRY